MLHIGHRLHAFFKEWKYKINASIIGYLLCWWIVKNGRYLFVYFENIVSTRGKLVREMFSNDSETRLSQLIWLVFIVGWDPVNEYLLEMFTKGAYLCSTSYVSTSCFMTWLTYNLHIDITISKFNKNEVLQFFLIFTLVGLTTYQNVSSKLNCS